MGELAKLEDIADLDDFDFAQSALISYERFNNLYKDILDCQEMTRASGDPHCIAIDGVLGVGKSTLVKSFVNASLQEVVGSRYKPSAIYVYTPEEKHSAAIASAILDQLGDPFPDRGRVWAQKRRIKNFCRDLNVSTIVFDDFQHLWDRKRNAPLYDEAEYLKSLIKLSEKTIVVTGLKGQIDRILDANDQLSSLFSVRETLEPFKWDDDNAAEFATFIDIAMTKLGFTLDTPRPREDMLGDIHYATFGVARNIFLLLRGSALIARWAGSDVITLKQLSAAFNKRLAKREEFKGIRNPFLE
jgi:hypothetical protein